MSLKLEMNASCARTVEVHPRGEALFQATPATVTDPAPLNVHPGRLPWIHRSPTLVSQFSAYISSEEDLKKSQEKKVSNWI